MTVIRHISWGRLAPFFVLYVTWIPSLSSGMFKEVHGDLVAGNGEKLQKTDVELLRANPRALESRKNLDE